MAKRMQLDYCTLILETAVFYLHILHNTISKQSAETAVHPMLHYTTRTRRREMFVSAKQSRRALLSRKMKKA